MSYQVKNGEETYVHVKVVRREFDSKSGKPLFKPYVHICTPRDFEIFLNSPNGLSIEEVLHLPKGYELPKLKKTVNGEKIEKEYPILEGFYTEKKTLTNKKG